MNKIEQLTNNIINNAIINKDFINYESLYNLHLKYGVKGIILISPKGISGKSTGVAKLITDRLTLNDFNAAWLRSRKEELKAPDIVSTFIALLGEKEYRINSYGIYKINNLKNWRARGTKVVAFDDVNTFLNSGSQNALKCDIVVYDEFINPTFNIADLTYRFFNMISTYQRTKDACVFMLANAHESDNDLLNELGICFDWENGKTQIKYYEKTHILAIYITKYENKYLKKANDNTAKMFSQSEIVQNFLNGKVAYNNNWGVVSPNLIDNFNSKFKPLFIFDVIDESITRPFCVGKLDNKIYIYYLETLKYKCKRICYRAQDKREFNTYVYDIKDYQTVAFLLNSYSSGKLLFSKTYCRDVFIKLILPRLTMLIKQDNK